MKNKLLVSVFSVGVAGILLAYSCSRDEGNSSNPSSPNPVPAELVDIGAQHNAGVAFVLEKLNQYPRTRSGETTLSKTEVKAVAKEGTKEFVTANYQLSKEVKEQVFDYIDRIIDGEITLSDEIVYGSLTPAQQVLAEELDAIFMDGDDDLKSLTDRIAAVEAKAKESLSGAELDAVLAGCYVGTYTLQYWHDNMDRWVEIAPVNPDGPFIDGFSWKWLGKEDLKGGINGATGCGGVVLVTGPVGWTGWAASILGAALGASLGNVIDQFWP